MSSASTPAPPPGLRMRGVGRAVFLIGLALSVAGALVVVALIWQILDPAAAPSGERQTVDGSVEVSLEEDERRYFFIPAEAHEDTGRDGAVETSYTPLAESNCTVEGPDAEQLPIRGAQTITEGGDPHVADDGFRARETGTYTVTCDPTPADAEVVVAPPTLLVQMQGRFVWLSVASAGVSLFGTACIVGLVLWLVGRRTLKRNGAL
ncbi:MAG TPA: hypothetical protein K8V08_06110 [Brevibacterium senegalense]|uniref:Uncharacterized protein n=1 Tax=Brevibacterium senegalense TaxID=1033736 RepID=A0A921MDU0_9MICO|nr:hypothetical protein [Brevibacterium senegalense]